MAQKSDSSESISISPDPADHGDHLSDPADFADYDANLAGQIIAEVQPPTQSLSNAAYSVIPPVMDSEIPQVQRPYTKWYRVWERTTVADFQIEIFFIPLLILVIVLQICGRRKNKAIATNWMTAHEPLLRQEFAAVGFETKVMDKEVVPQNSSLVSQTGASDLLKESSLCNYSTYATGRLNIAFLDVHLFLAKRHNPVMRLADMVLGIFFQAYQSDAERVEATANIFDGREKELVSGDAPLSGLSPLRSKYDDFVWAVVNKDCIARLRRDRYDVSLASTKEHPQLPSWAAIMTESAEITDTLLTPELLNVITLAGNQLEYLLITDQPAEQPQKLEDIVQRKRVILSVRLSNSDSQSSSIREEKKKEQDYSNQVPLFHYFLRLPDRLVSVAHYRPDVRRKIKEKREARMQKISKQLEDEKAEERRRSKGKEKKEKRDQMMKLMGPEEQKKFLERERNKEIKRNQKKKMVRA